MFAISVFVFTFVLICNLNNLNCDENFQNYFLTSQITQLFVDVDSIPNENHDLYITKKNDLSKINDELNIFYSLELDNKTLKYRSKLVNFHLSENIFISNETVPIEVKVFTYNTIYNNYHDAISKQDGLALFKYIFTIDLQYPYLENAAKLKNIKTSIKINDSYFKKLVSGHKKHFYHVIKPQKNINFLNGNLFVSGNVKRISYKQLREVNKAYGNLKKDLLLKKYYDASDLIFDIEFSPDKNFVLKNNGQAVELFINNYIQFTLTNSECKAKYVSEFVDFHFGENNEDISIYSYLNEKFVFEMHVITYNTDYNSFSEAINYSDGILVIVYLFKINEKENKILKNVVKSLKEIKCASEYTYIKNLNFEQLLGYEVKDLLAFLYPLSSKPGSMKYNWFISPRINHISSSQLDAFRNIYQDEKCTVTLKKNFLHFHNSLISSTSE